MTPPKIYVSFSETMKKRVLYVEIRFTPDLNHWLKITSLSSSSLLHNVDSVSSFSVARKEERDRTDFVKTPSVEGIILLGPPQDICPGVPFFSARGLLSQQLLGKTFE